MDRRTTLAYMSPQEEADIKRNIPWEDLDPKILETVRIANSIDGIATVQSCAGHIKYDGEELFTENANLAFLFNRGYKIESLLETAQHVGISDVSIRFFGEGFCMCLSVEPERREKLRDFLEAVNNENV